MTRTTSSLLSWTNPRASAQGLGAILASLIALKYLDVSSLLLWGLAAWLVVASGAQFASQVVGLPSVRKLAGPAVQKAARGATVEYYAPHVVTIYKKYEQKALSLILVDDVQSSVKAGLAFYVAYLVVSTLGLWNVFFFGTIVAFAFQPVYQSNKKVIDESVEKVQKEVCAVYNGKVKPVVGQYVLPFWKTLESKLPVRTAGSTVGAETASSATTTGSEAAAASTATDAPPAATEVDFNALGEQLKRDAEKATADAAAFSRAKVDDKFE